MTASSSVDSNLSNLKDSSPEYVTLTKIYPALKYSIPPFDLLVKPEE